MPPICRISSIPRAGTNGRIRGNDNQIPGARHRQRKVYIGTQGAVVAYACWPVRCGGGESTRPAPGQYSSTQPSRSPMPRRRQFTTPRMPRCRAPPRPGTRTLSVSGSETVQASPSRTLSGERGRGGAYSSGRGHDQHQSGPIDDDDAISTTARPVNGGFDHGGHSYSANCSAPRSAGTECL